MLTKLKRMLAPSVLEQEQIDNWEKKGFLVLKSFFSTKDLSAYDQEVSHIMENRQTLAGDITIDILEGELQDKRMRLKDVPNEALRCGHKINDLFLESEACRNLNLNKRLCRVLNDLLGDSPIVINSLSFRKGSQQPHHFDTYFMPPPVQDMMVVTSICLEDQTSESGPLSFYPGSHRIPPYIFSHGGIHAVKEEMEKATRYTMAEIDKLGLKRESFLGKAGDVFIWHAQLYHGGLEITDPNQTRKTLVTHYWRRKDVDRHRVAVTLEGGYYMLREHQTINDER